MKTTSTPAVEWPPGGAAPTRGTASQGRAATDFGALLDQTQARTAVAEGHKRDGEKTSVAPRDDRRDGAASARPERPERPEHPHRTDRPERPERPEHPHAPVADQAAEQPEAGAAEGEQPAEPQADTGQQPQGDTVEQPVVVAAPVEAVADVVLPVVEAAPVAAPAEPVAEAPVTSVPVVGPQPAAEAVVVPVVTVEQADAAPVAAQVVSGQPAAVAVGEQPVAAADQPVTALQQPQAAAQPQQQATGQQQQPQPQQAQPTQQSQPQVDASTAPAVAERSVEGDQPQAGGQQPQQQTGQSGQQQPSAEQPVVTTARAQQQPATSAPADNRVQAPAASNVPTVTATPVAEAQQTARPVDVTPRTARFSPAAEAVENAIRIGQARGVTHARMSLKPAELGGVEIRLAQTAQGLSATVVADGVQAAQLLQQAGQELRRSLEAQGIQLHQLDISYSGEERNGARSAEAQADGGERRSSADDSVATDGDGLTTTEDITVKETLELPDGVLVDVLA